MSNTIQGELTLQKLADLYTSIDLPRLCPETRENAARILKRFVAALGAERPAASIRRIEVVSWLQACTNWKSSHARKNAIGVVKRLFFFANEMELLDRNPAWRLRIAWGEPARERRALTDEEFRTLLRNAPPYLRRLLFFVAMTGCRPAEARVLTWDHIDLAAGMATLKRHKTSGKTRRPRRLFLPPVLVRLLTWMKRNPLRRTWHGRKATARTASDMLRELLRHGPVSAKDVAARLRPLGVSYRMIGRAKTTIGAGFRWLGRGRGGEYFLPADQKKAPEPAGSPLLFVNERGTPWTKSALARNVCRLRQRIGMPEGISLYYLRHTYATRALKKRVALKLVSELLGHSRTSITEEVYLHMEVLQDEMAEAAAIATAGLFTN